MGESFTLKEMRVVNAAAEMPVYRLPPRCCGGKEKAE
jgi:hypothetical protein